MRAQPRFRDFHSILPIFPALRYYSSTAKSDQITCSSPRKKPGSDAGPLLSELHFSLLSPDSRRCFFIHCMLSFSWYHPTAQWSVFSRPHRSRFPDPVRHVGCCLEIVKAWSLHFRATYPAVFGTVFFWSVLEALRWPQQASGLGPALVAHCTSSRFCLFTHGDRASHSRAIATSSAGPSRSFEGSSLYVHDSMSFLDARQQISYRLHGRCSYLFRLL